MESLNKKRVIVRNDSDETEQDAPEVKRLRDVLIGFLEDTDPVPETRDLDCVIRILEDEISVVSSSSSLLTDNTSTTEDSKPDLHYLLQASDDELGLPPRISFSKHEGGEMAETLELVGTSALCAGVEEIWGLENFFLNDHSVESGNWIDYNSDFEYVALDKLFE